MVLLLMLFSILNDSFSSIVITNETLSVEKKEFLSIKELITLYLKQNQITSSSLIRQIKSSLETKPSIELADGRKYVKQIYENIRYDYKKISYSLNEHPNGKNPQFTETDLNSVLILTLINDKDSYGSSGRTFHRYIKTIKTILDKSNFNVSLGVLCNNKEEIKKIENYLDSPNNQEKIINTINNVDLIFAPSLEKSDPSLSPAKAIDRKNRHSDSLQRLRRRTIAKLRNFLLSNTLTTQDYVLFVDSDIIKFKNPKTFLSTMINADKDIIVPRIDINGMKDYDKNSWRGERTKPNKNQLKKMDSNNWDNLDYTPKDKQNKMYHFENYLNNDKDEYEKNKNDLNYVVPLDSVGGAVLLIKSIIFKQGIIFPTSYIVGTTWDRLEGYDGIETEGICYIAKPLNYSCWGLPNLYALHAGT